MVVERLGAAPSEQAKLPLGMAALVAGIVAPAPPAVPADDAPLAVAFRHEVLQLLEQHVQL